DRARPPDGAAGATPSVVRVGEQQGLRHAGAPRGTRAARLYGTPPENVRAGRAAGAAERWRAVEGGGRRARHVGSTAFHRPPPPFTALFSPFRNPAKGRVF